MKARAWFLAGALCGLGSAAPRAAEWTLECCTQAALSYSPRLERSAAQVAAQRATRDEARASRWPVLSITGTYKTASETMRLQLPSFGAFTPPAIEFGDGQTADLMLSASALLYSGGAASGRIRAHAAALGAARHELAADSLAVLHAVRQAYYRALGADAQLRAARVAEERLRRHLDQLEAAIEIGTGSEEARVQALARLRQTEQRCIAAQADLSARRLELGRLIGRPGVGIQPSGELGEPLLISGEAERAAVEPRPELAALTARMRQSDAQAAVARAVYLPSLSAQVGLHQARPGIDIIANEWMEYASAGVVLSWSLWEWGARAARVEQVRAQRRVLDHQHTALSDALHQGLATAHVFWDAAREQEQKARERVELERRRFALIVGRYLEASASESERLDAADDLAAAESDLAAAQAGVRLAEIEILRFLCR